MSTIENNDKFVLVVWGGQLFKRCNFAAIGRRRQKTMTDVISHLMKVSDYRSMMISHEPEN